jgi:hypothetical protein
MKLIGTTVLFLLFSANVFAAQIAGTVTNGTSNKPAVGDEVVLLSLSGGMDEIGRTKTDAQGHFSLNAPDQGQKLVRVDHQGVNYFKSAPQAATGVDITVFDVAKKIENLVGEGRVFRFQTLPKNLLEVQEMFILRNESSPARTQQSYEIDLPAGAQIEEGVAESPSGMPTNVPPSPVAGKKNRFSIPFPVRPGRTRFQVTYKVPYAGTREFKLTPDLPLAELGVMIPKSMQFSAGSGNFVAAQDEAGMTVYVAKSVPSSKEIRFSVSGEGTAPTDTQAAGGSRAGAPQTRSPGGGLGAPIEAPDPLSGARWYIIAIFVVVLAAGGYWLYRMQKHPSPASMGPGTTPPQQRGGPQKSREVVRASSPSRPLNGSNGAGVLDAIKEELFQLESDRLQGKLTQQEYETSKAGLETLMRRQLKRTEESRKK